jgi:hypothetical protein
MVLGFHFVGKEWTLIRAIRLSYTSLALVEYQAKAQLYKTRKKGKMISRRQRRKTK